MYRHPVEVRRKLDYVRSSCWRGFAGDRVKAAAATSYEGLGLQLSDLEITDTTKVPQRGSNPCMQPLRRDSSSPRSSQPRLPTIRRSSAAAPSFRPEIVKDPHRQVVQSGSDIISQNEHMFPVNLISELAKACSQGVNLASVPRVRGHAEKADPVRLWRLLRPCRERPRRRPPPRSDMNSRRFIRSPRRRGRAGSAALRGRAPWRS
jgi:hypothetical protein